MLGNQLSFLNIPKANAQTATPDAKASTAISDHDELGLIAILAENSLLEDVKLRDHIFRYAENAQGRIPHSQALVFGVDKNESTFRIASILEKLYYEGMDSDALDTNPLNNDNKKEDDNRLIGIVIVGDVPIPVVNEADGTTLPSLYPYTDFYRKRYIYNHETDKFESNGDVSSPNPEIWHGVIVPPSKNEATAKQELIEFFEKNEAYSSGNPDFTNFDKRMLYANFPAMEKQMNFMDYRNYERYLKYMEEMEFNRYNKDLLKELIKEVSADMGSDEPIMPEETIDAMLDVDTELIFKKYTAPLTTAIQTYLGRLNDVVKKTGRWSSAEIDTPGSLVAIRDGYAQKTLHKKQLELEKQVDNLVLNTVPLEERDFNLTTEAKLKIKTKIINIGSGTKNFTFYGLIDGKPVSEIQSVEDCGMYIGQKSQSDQSVLENNSVYVEANRLYDPESMIEPPKKKKKWKLENQDEYKNYAGCVYNNSMKIDIDDDHLDPAKCIRNESVLPLFSVRGSHEVANKIEGDRCSEERITFYPGNDSIFEKNAKGRGSGSIKLKSVIDKVYNKLADDGDVTNNVAGTRARSTEIIQALLKTGKKIKYKPSFGVELEISASESGVKAIDYFERHVEPTNETIKIIKQIKEDGCDPDSTELKVPEIVTPSTPADGIRYVEFKKNDEKEKFEYLDFYRIEGENPAAIAGNLIAKIGDKDYELSQKIGVTTYTTNLFFQENNNVIEPIIWNSLGADQKLINIIPKYLDRDSLMPVLPPKPGETQTAPVIKPNGYEVLHIVADGDAHGYQLGLNKAMRPAPEIKESAGGEGEGEGEGESKEMSGSGNENKKEFKCGDPSGVEIWEWFDALQCWIEDEILPAGELIKLDDSCGAEAPAPEEKSKEESAAKLTVDLINDTSMIPVQFNVNMERKSLVNGETTTINLYPLNSDGKNIFGYIDAPVHLELSDPSLGEFDKNDFHIFTGEDSVSFTAKKNGTTTLTVTMGDAPKVSFTISIYDSIKVSFSDQKEVKDGETIFNIKATLLNQDGNRIDNINTDIVLGALKPTDGKFEKNGTVQLVNGQGEGIFHPNPGPPIINIISKDQYYTSVPYSITPPPAQPVALTLKPPAYIKVSETVKIPVSAVDAKGNVATGFNETITVKLNEDTKDYAQVLTPTIALSDGKGEISVKAGKQSAEIQLIAEYGKLKKGIMNIPIFARMESDEWANTYPQNLFASFVGFPAGDFLEEKYFGGTHLFSGKTEAVFSFMTAATPPAVLSILPNYRIIPTENSQTIYPEFTENQMLLQVFDQKTYQTLISKNIPLNFDETLLYAGEKNLKKNTMYLDLMSEAYKIKKSGNGLIVSDNNGKIILSLKPNKIYLPDTSYSLSYNNEPEFDATELILTNGFEQIARVILNFSQTDLNPDDFDEINDYYTVEKTYNGKSTNDPGGLVLYDPRAEIAREEIGEYYGMEGDNQYIKLFAAGSPIGDAVKFNLPANGVLLGDPTIKIKTKTSGGLSYDSTIGRQLFTDPEGSNIISINEFNFNNDAYKDNVLIMQDGRVRLLEGGPTEPMFKDKGDITFLADGAIAVERFDFKKDGYEDLLIATDEGRLAILNNDKEVITRTDQKINAGKKLYKLMKGDMDADGFEDLVTLDSRGDIRIFYNNNGRFSENGKLIGNYGFSLKLGQNLYKDLDVRYPGLKTPNSGISEIDTSVLPSATFSEPVVTPSDSIMNELENFSGGKSKEPSESESNALFDTLGKIAETGMKNPTATLDSESPPLLPWPEENDTETKSDDQTATYFTPVENVDFLTIKKTVSNKERPDAKNLDLGENLVYTIEIKSNINKNNVVLADTVPDSLSPLIDSAKCEGNGCKDFQAKQVDTRLFLSGLDLKADKPITITYEATVKHTPQADFFIQRLNGSSPEVTNDQYPDIVVSPPYNNTNDFIQHYTTEPRVYKTRSTSDDVKPKTASAIAITNTMDIFTSAVNALSAIDVKNKDLKISAIKMPAGVSSAVCEEMGGSQCFEDADSTTGCANDFLDDLAGSLSNFSCMGGGCFPMPWNFTFMVPPQMPLPIFAFPTSTCTPFPCPGALAMPGAAAVPGPIMSMIRLYLGVSLTGGLGIAFCWGPYMGSATPPPPVFPIPYPPPIGNCIVTALPVDTIFGGLCGKIAEGMKKVMETINSGVNKINSAMASVNNDDSIPFGAEESGQEEGAGGLEISLGVNLGNSMKFEPPAKSFSNIHIPTFDSVMGKISDWFDRQTLEIMNKLLRLPSFYVYLPDIKSLFTLDADRMEKQFNIWVENISQSPDATGKTLDAISKLPPSGNGTKGSKSAVDEIITALEQGKSSKALQYMNAVEKQAQIYNSNLFDGLYDVASALPLINLTEKQIEFKVPWLSAAEIQAYILELQQWVLYYEREYARVKDIWEKYSCQDQAEAETLGKGAENAINCGLRQLADAFAVNFEDTLESVQENIDVLQAWLAFPKDFVKFRGQLIDYIRGVACYLNVWSQMLGGWYGKLQEQMISWASLILTISEIVKNWKNLFDVFLDFDSNCSTCTNERYANFGWWSLLGLILPDIPVIAFPKLPDIVLDMSNMDLAINIELPILHLSPQPLPLPPLPYLRLPDIPNINLFLQLPRLPVLPRPPAFPDLPKLPPIPVIDLPGLPAPPKIPDLGASFETIIGLMEKILKIWCIMKKAFAPVPESMLNDQITLLTNRPAYLIPLDVMKLQAPKIALFDLGFNQLRIETVIYLGLRIKIISRFLESKAEDWNKLIKSIPDEMNKSYAEYIKAAEEKAQEEMDKIGTDVSEAIEKAEKDFNTSADLEDAFKGADDYLRQKEQKWQEWADEQKLDWDYQKYVNAINDANDAIQNGFTIKIGDLVIEWPGSAAVRDDIDTFFDEYGDYIHMMNYFIPLAAHLEAMDKYKANKELQEHIFDNIGKGMDLSISIGPAGMEQLLRYLDACEKDEKECENEDDYLGYNNTDTEQLGGQLQTLLNQLADITKQINNAEPVDYQKIKDELGVPDFKAASRITSVDKINWMKKELLAYSDNLEKETKLMKDVKDLYALAEVAPAAPFQLANQEYEPVINTEKERVFTSAIIPKGTTAQSEPEQQAEKQTAELKEKVEREVKPLTAEDNNSEDNASCAGMCLPDPVTSQPTPFIPSLNYPKLSETLFLESGHAAYSDGKNYYLKRNLVAPMIITNMGKSVPDRIFRIDDVAQDFWYSKEPMEAVNMLKTTLTENGSSGFTWRASTNPNVYGYGIEMERSILGFDANEQENKLPDVKFVLLPPNEDESAPEVIVDNRQVIPYGTLVTSMKDKEEAQKYFGIKSDNIITSAKKIKFSTIGSATISVDENTAFYFDKYAGPNYSINMENGFYHIKMMWFDKSGRTSTYNQSELLSPQTYAGAAAPIDIAFDTVYYTPIYKEKVIRASSIFTDLSGAYKYYWYMDVENNPLTPEVGKELLIPAQKEPKEFLVKLVATQDIEDKNFKRFEKTFKVVVYVPSIELDGEKLSNGIVKGKLSPIPEAPDDNLGDIPFSLFRKRWDIWKNLGFLLEKKGAKTKPPLEDGSYYSVGKNGAYEITGFDTSDPSPILVKDENNNTVARVIPGTGRIEVIDNSYMLQALPGATNLPTRIAVIKTKTKEIIANVYYVPDRNTDIVIREEPLSVTNVMDIGVTAGDANAGDDIIAKNIPGYAPSYPGGIAIYNQTPPQKNVALIDTDGSIRMMQAGYKLQIKNPSANNEPYIFEITTDNNKPIFDIYIRADFENLVIKQDLVMSDTGIQIGLKEQIDRLFSPLIQTTTESTTNIAGSAAQSGAGNARQTENPFPDLDKSHPFYQQILELYKRRVISGYGDGTFRPNDKITRAEFIKIALGVTNCYDCSSPTAPQREKYTPVIPFPDVTLPAWYYFCIWIAKDLKMITGYGDGLFRPARNISRAEAAAVLLRQSKIEITKAPSNAFADVPDYAWYKDYVYTAIQIGLIKETGGFVFPDEEITRGEFAFMGMGVINMQDCHEVDEDKDGMPDWWEMENNLDPLYAVDAASDYDFDGLTALKEYQLGTNPNKADTDGDGIPDGKDETPSGEIVVTPPAVTPVTCPYTDNPNQNDTDEDGLIDVYDDDVDNDGISNAACVFDKNGLVDPAKLEESKDNCVFIANPDQTDSDLNGVGDACEPFDLCPPVPEDLDGVNDEDGCPEVDDIFPDDPPGVYATPGPICSFLDYTADLVKGDTIMTAITDTKTHDVIFQASKEATYKP
jgi:uncharacterized repeat protein (TIGR01451 family)